MISQAFQVLENAHKMGTCRQYFKEYLTVDTNWDEEFYVGVVSTFVTMVIYLVDEVKKNKYLPSNPRIRQIQAGWKGRIDIMKYLEE